MQWDARCSARGDPEECGEQTNGSARTEPAHMTAAETGQGNTDKAKIQSTENNKQDPAIQNLATHIFRFIHAVCQSSAGTATASTDEHQLVHTECSCVC